MFQLWNATEAYGLVVMLYVCLYTLIAVMLVDPY